MIPLAVTTSNNPLRKLRRQHGFQLPLHPLQVSGWLILAALSTGAFLILIPALPLYLQSAIAISLTCLISLHLAAHLASALTDPAEESLRLTPPQPIPSLDRTKHIHVIENGFCNLCMINISDNRTKHCSACNKCVAGFDHHCKWLNHCVGSRNYTAFLMCVTSAIIAALAISILAFSELVYHKFNMISYVNVSTNETIPSSLPSSDAAYFAAVGIIGLLAAIATGLLLHLCFFHIYISFLGLTTYEYIRNQRYNTTIQQHDINNQNDENSSNIYHRCSSLRHRPVDLNCENRSSKLTLVTCSLFKETYTFERRLSPISEQNCKNCFNNRVVPEIDVKKSPKKVKNKWNCCSSVPESPEETVSPNEPKCLLSLCRHKFKKKNASGDGRQSRTHGHWSSAKLRMLIRVIGSIGTNRRRIRQNQAQQNTKSNSSTPMPAIYGGSSTGPVQTVNNLIPVPLYPDVSKKANSLPALPRFPRRRFIGELETVSSISAIQLQQQQVCQQRKLMYSHHSRRRRSNVHRPKTPALSPIRESGLSNPASPSRHYSVNSIIGA